MRMEVVVLEDGELSVASFVSEVGLEASVDWRGRDVIFLGTYPNFRV